MSEEVTPTHQDQIVPRTPSRSVPMDLLPVKINDVNIIWGKKTFQYFHLFDSNINKAVYENDDDVLGWCRYANKLQDQLKS